MLLHHHPMAGMSEANIAVAYSNYLQAVAIAQKGMLPEKMKSADGKQYFLSYDEFKEYYILKLVGKTDYIDNLVRKIQLERVV